MKRFWKPLVAVVTITVVVYLGFGYAMYDRLSAINAADDVCGHSRANRPDRFGAPQGSDPLLFDYSPYYIPRYENVRFPSRQQGLTLSGWYAEARPGAPAVVLLDGIDGCKYTASVLLPAGMLWHQGINVLMIDVRDTGDSDYEDGRTALGTEEWQDVLGAWDWLLSTRGYAPGRIGLYANSLGTVAALAAFEREPRIASVFLHAPVADLSQALQEELQRAGSPAFLWLGSVAMGRLVSGDDLLAVDPQEAVRSAGGRPMYFVHNRYDTRVSYHHSEQLAEIVGETGAQATIWLVDDSPDLSALTGSAPEFAARLAEFFRVALSD